MSDGSSAIFSCLTEARCIASGQLRSSCENDWKTRNVAEPTYATWLGHDPSISRKHYVSPTDQEYARVTGVR